MDAFAAWFKMQGNMPMIPTRSNLVMTQDRAGTCIDSWITDAPRKEVGFSGVGRSYDPSLERALAFADSQKIRSGVQAEHQPQNHQAVTEAGVVAGGTTA